MLSTVGCADEILKEWVKGIVTNNKDILAVQTLRNWTMASTLLGSTAIIIALGIVNYIFDKGDIDLNKQYFDIHSLVGQQQLNAKLLLLVVIFFYIFMNYSLAVRAYSRTGFILGIKAVDGAKIKPENGVKTLIRGARHYTMGMRGYYISIPIILWLFDPYWMLAGMVGLVIFLFMIDYQEAKWINS